jgi:hypothetical protein
LTGLLRILKTLKNPLLGDQLLQFLIRPVAAKACSQAAYATSHILQMSDR